MPGCMPCENYILKEGKLRPCPNLSEKIIVFKVYGLKSRVLCEECLAKHPKDCIAKIL